MTRADRFRAWFDVWVQRGTFSANDLGIYRILYAVGALLVVPDITWVAQFPQFMFHPPPGPFQLLPGIPPLGVLIALEVIRTILLVLLGLGVWTRGTSIATFAILLVTNGISFSFGKINHDILIVLTPLLLAFTNWGDSLSVDALVRKKPALQVPQWPLRLFALIIGLAFFNAAFVKVMTGWLSWSTQAAHNQFYALLDSTGRMFWLTEAAARFHFAPAWELLDWLTVIVEFSLLATVLWWRYFRLAVAATAVFHLGVLLVMAIAFSASIVAYGAFVSWAKLIRPRWWLLALPPAALTARLVLPDFGFSAAVVVGGGLLGACYLAYRLATSIRAVVTAR